MELKEIRRDIRQLEDGPVNPSTVEKLALYYAVEKELTQRDGDSQPIRYSAQPIMQPVYSMAAEKPRYTRRSEFLALASEKEPEAVVEVFDRLMDTFKTTNPKIYEEYMEFVRRL